jgi:Spy/CpxP family protein refolding chaperone
MAPRLFVFDRILPSIMPAISKRLVASLVEERQSSIETFHEAGTTETRMNKIASRFALLALALSAVGFGSSALAQDNAPAGSSSSASSGMGRHGAPDPQKQVQRLTKRLGLSDAQSSKILAILQNRQQQMEALRGDSAGSQQDRREKMRSLQQDSDTQINAVLTPAQQTQYAAMKQQMRDRMQNGRNGGGNGGGDSNSGSNGN